MTSENTSRQQTRQQERAANAWHAITQLELDHARDDKLKKEYGSIIRGLPAMIQMDGLGHTLAFLKAKSGGDPKKAHYVAYDQLSRWLHADLHMPATQDLLDWLIHQNTGLYRRATAESQAYLQWLKRFVEAKKDEWGLEEPGA